MFETPPLTPAERISAGGLTLRRLSPERRFLQRVPPGRTQTCRSSRTSVSHRGRRGFAENGASPAQAGLRAIAPRSPDCVGWLTHRVRVPAPLDLPALLSAFR